jgi:hypothetical protein
VIKFVSDLPQVGGFPQKQKHIDNQLLCHFQQYFSYIMAVSFIGGGNQSTPRKPPTCGKSLTNMYIYRTALTACLSDK